MGWMIDFVVDLVEERVDLDGSQFSDSILERWYFAYALQQNVTVLEFENPCPPRSPLLTHDSRHDQLRVLPFFHELFFSNVECFANMNRTYLKTIWHIFCVYFNNESPPSFMFFSNVGIFTVLKWTCLDCTRFNNGSRLFFWKIVFEWKRESSISWTGRFSSILHNSRVILENGSPSSLPNWI